MGTTRSSCGAELAEDAEVPERLGQLMHHVAGNLRAHASWVGTGSPEAELEHHALQQVAEGYESIAAAAIRTAQSMRAMASLPEAAHDDARFERDSFLRWMKEKVVLQRALGEMLLEHAARSERVVDSLPGK